MSLLFALQVYSPAVSHFALKTLPVLGKSARNPLSPHPKAGGLELSAHDLDDFGFAQPGLFFDFLESRPIFPGKANNLIG